jgi:hypothetical protein
MKTKTAILAAVGLTLMFLASLAVAQSLGDIARQERERRAKETKKPVKVFTSDDVAALAPAQETKPAAAAESAEQPPAETTAPAEKTPPAPQPEETKPEDKQKTRDYWQGRFRAARQKVAEAEELQRLAEDELSLLQIQQARELNPDAQSTLEAQVKAKNAELEDKRAQTAKAQKALEDLEKDFKESGAPEDWSKTD